MEQIHRVQIAALVRGWGQTTRPDAWWLQPLVVFLGLSTAIGWRCQVSAHGGRVGA